MPRSSAPILSPASPWSSSLRNISTPVTTVLAVGRRPTISISSPTFTTPRSTRPVTTVPRPEIENTSSIGIRNGLSFSRVRCGMYFSTPPLHLRHQLQPRLLALLGVLVLQRHQRRAADHRDVVARELVALQELAHFQLHQVEKLGVVHHVDLVHEHDKGGHADLACQEDMLAR